MAVLNKRTSGVPAGAVYIGRGSRWGNPFTHLQGTTAPHVVKDRNEACDRYAQWIKEEIRSGRVSLPALASLYGKDLVCYCAPQRCHGDALEKLSAWAKDRIQQDVEQQ